tara:strand:+ start:153 stop:362 length:210 start_codon:yes stop_codon:yes gene_type:complete
MFIATTQGLKYDHMVISETEEKAWLGLKKWWQDTWEEEEGMSFDKATEWHGFFVRSTPIILGKPFNIHN